MLYFNLLKGRSEEDGIPDVEEEEDEEDDIIHETLFTFEAFESVWNSCFLVYSLPHFSLEICQCRNYPHPPDIPGTISRFRII